MIIRQATLADVAEAAAIYDVARTFMRAVGNMEQWNSGHPNAQDIKDDIARGGSYVCVEEDEIVGVFYFRVEDDPTYRTIYEGAWGAHTPYAVIHRVAVKYNGRGIAARIFSFCCEQMPHLRIDTHRDNIPMQRALAKYGFVYRGIIHLVNGDERMAFERL